MYLKFLFSFLSVLLLSVLQISFFNSVPEHFDSVNLILVALVFVLVIFGFNFSFWWILSAGVLLDLFSFNFFGLNILSLFFSILVINFLLNNFLTNRSIYVFLILIIVATITHDFFFNFFIFMIDFFSGEKINFFVNSLFWKKELARLIFNSISVLILFYLFILISRRLRPVFLEKK